MASCSPKLPWLLPMALAWLCTAPDELELLDELDEELLLEELEEDELLLDDELELPLL